jgi:hypothetical protein
VIRAAIAIALYSWSRQRDIADPLRPGAELAGPRVVGRLYQPRRIEVGYRVGAAIRRSRTVRVEGEDEPEAVPRARVSPHLRAAHCLVNTAAVSHRAVRSLRVRFSTATRSQLLCTRNLID